MDDLNSLREELNEIDEEIFRLISRRLKVSSRIGQYKQKNNLPIRDLPHERSIIQQNTEKWGKIGHEISEILIKSSCAVQEKKPASKPFKITVIGGKGGMGNWAVSFFSSRGHRVSIIDKGDPLTIDDSEDVIILATPIGVTSEIIDHLSRLQVKGLVFELASLKNPILKSIENARMNGLNITSIHPMFGPETEDLVDQTILVCGEIETVLPLFEGTCVNLHAIPIDKHDEIVCYITALTHLLNYLFVFSLEELDIPCEIGSTSFKLQLEAAKRVFKGNPRLYFEILRENEYSKALISSLISKLSTFKILPFESFQELFSSGFHYLKN